ncbi:hypothetical protein BJ508DRAFT_190157, partial [Ascobolus immersus RN42]
PGANQAGQPVDCQAWYIVDVQDNCLDIASKVGISASDFFAWNPSVGTDCSAIWRYSSVCVGTVRQPYGELPSPPVQTTVPQGPLPDSPVPAPFADLPYQPVDCNLWYIVKYTQSCNNVLSTLRMTLERLYELNPDIGETCSNLWAAYGVCIGTVRKPYAPDPSVPKPTPTIPSWGSDLPIPTGTGYWPYPTGYW